MKFATKHTTSPTSS